MTLEVTIRSPDIYILWLIDARNILSARGKEGMQLFLEAELIRMTGTGLSTQPDSLTLTLSRSVTGFIAASNSVINGIRVKVEIKKCSHYSIAPDIIVLYCFF